MSTIDDEAATWMVRRASRELTGEEQAQFDSWYAADIRHQGAYLRAVAVDHALDRAAVQRDLRPHAANTGVRPRRWFAHAVAGGMAVAATLAVLAGALPLLRQDRGVDLVTAKGETRQFPLADTSIASLNSGSEVQFRQTDSLREVRLLRGEAWFQVAKDRRKPFIVEAGDVRVRAVGTAFSVRREGQGAEVLVTEGVVEVWRDRGTGRRILLSRGEQARVSEQDGRLEAMRQPAEVERKLAWRRGRIVFTNQTLGEAVADFNRYSPRKIVIVDPDLVGLTFVGQYAIDAPEVFAKDVSTYLGVPLHITADAILIGEARQGRRPAPGKG